MSNTKKTLHEPKNSLENFKNLGFVYNESWLRVRVQVRTNEEQQQQQRQQKKVEFVWVCCGLELGKRSTVSIAHVSVCVRLTLTHFDLATSGRGFG